jgi:hypothetical protein
VTRKWRDDKGRANFVEQTTWELTGAFTRNALRSSMNPFNAISTVNSTRQKPIRP